MSALTTSSSEYVGTDMIYYSTIQLVVSADMIYYSTNNTILNHVSADVLTTSCIVL
jgi:hypothetical protein